MKNGQSGGCKGGSLVKITVIFMPFLFDRKCKEIWESVGVGHSKPYSGRVGISKEAERLWWLLGWKCGWSLVR